MKRWPLSSTQTMLVMAAIGLSGGIAYERVAPPSHREISVPVASPKPPARRPPTPFIAPPLSNFDDIDHRPIFSPNRKPVEEARATAPPPLASLVLIGVILDKTDRIAVLRTQASPIAVNARLGQRVEGWTITGIESDRIKMEAGGVKEEVRLHPGRGEPGTTSPPASAFR